VPISPTGARVAASRRLHDGRHRAIYVLALLHGSPSFLAHQRILSEGQGRSNCQTLFAIAAISSDKDIRQMLDGAPTAALSAVL
jgi:hypothetical protein